ncbi:MAG: TonB-dependent receptor [Bacteroidota bacterium]
MRIVLSLLLLLQLSALLAQPPRRSGAPPAITISGKVVTGPDQQPIEFATVMIADPNTEEAITGTTTDQYGNFSVRSRRRAFYVEVSFLGFETRRITEFERSRGEVQLGTIELRENSQTLDEVTVRAEKSSTEFQLDKRVFNVGKDLSSTGASALEVLNNVPSVNVNIEGEISLRGSSGVQVLINGKPSILADEAGSALGTITAEMIDRIEVITNPSAKYDAEGTTGIINIVIKKDEREGLNGSVSLNTGWPHNHSVGLSLNRRTEKFNLFSQLGMGYRELPRETRNINRDLRSNTTIEGEGTQFRNELFYNLNLGTDYYINKYNVITLSGNFAYEIEDQPSRTDFAQIDAAGLTAARWFREEVTEATNPKYQYELQYKRDFPDRKDHALLFSALGNFFGKDQSSTFQNVNLSGDAATADQQTRTNFQEARYTFKLDYTKPFNDYWTLETGAQFVSNVVSNDFAVTDWINGEWVSNEGLTNVFEYEQKVLGVYATGAYEKGAWGLKAGLRVEHTDLQTLLVNTQATNNQNFANLFPSFHSSYKISESFSLQAGYSRRIRRPRLWDLNPFFNIRNNFSIRAGNPELLPEFTDSYELSSIFIFDKSSFNFSLFHRYTTDVIERIVRFEAGVSISNPENIGTNRTTGIELNGKYSPAKWVSFNGDFNLNFFQRNGEFENTSFDFAADRWSTRLTSKFKLPAKIDFEVTGRYRSRVETVQGINSDVLFADLGLRKKIWKGRGVLNLSIRDIFASRIEESNTTQPDFTTYSRRLRGRFVTLGFSYGFGKGEAMEYSGRRRR